MDWGLVVAIGAMPAAVVVGVVGFELYWRVLGRRRWIQRDKLETAQIEAYYEDIYRDWLARRQGPRSIKIDLSLIRGAGTRICK